MASNGWRKALASWRTGLLAATMLAATPSLLAAPRTDSPPSRPPAPGCAWEKFSDASLGLDAWVQRCSFGSRKIDFVTVGHSLAIRYSDGGAPDPVIDVLDLLPGETAQRGIERLYAARTDPALAKRCVLAPYRGYGHAPPGAQRYTFLPRADYQKELRKNADPEEVPDPACGDWGDAPDGIQYFEAQPGRSAQHVLFVRIGQDEPLFDEASLRIR